MARASTPTLLPLATWAKILGIEPWNFEQVGTGFPLVTHKILAAKSSSRQIGRVMDHTCPEKKWLGPFSVLNSQ